MPARTNDFQRLIKVINKHLAPADAKVTESAMLYDAEADIEREVDILVESTILNCNIKIGIECTALKSSLDVRRIEGFREKHRKLGINQTIVVAKNGFSKSAKNYAQKNNIKLLTFGAATQENWRKNFERLKDLSMYGRNYYLRSLYIVCKNGFSEADFKFDVSVKVKTINGYVSLESFAGNLFISAEVSKRACKELIENESRGDDPWVKVGFELGEMYEFEDSLGRVLRPQLMEVTMNYKSNYRKLSLEQGTYDGQPIVAGGYSDKNSHAHIVFDERKGELVGTVEFSSDLFPPNSVFS